MKPAKNKVVKQYTRARAEKALSSGEMRPEDFLDMKSPLAMNDPKNPNSTVNHRNFHVLRKAHRLMGNPVPDLSAEDMVKWNKLMRYTEKVAPVGTSVAVEEVSQ